MLKASDLPTYEQFMRPVLEFCQTENRPVLSKEIKQALIETLSYTSEDLAQKIPGGSVSERLKNRIHWATFYLKKAGCLTSDKRGVYELNPRGKQLLKSATTISNGNLQQFPEFMTFFKRDVAIKNGNYSTAPEPITAVEHISGLSPDEELKEAYALIRSNIRAELLETLKSIDPKAFEQIVLDLLVAMGYGGGKKEWAKVTRYTGDGGIDGFIKEDPLGLDMIYVQAKRYRDTSVGEPDLRNFKGSLADYAPCKGVFITTSQFVKKADEYASRHSIRLIDGDQLAELMLDYGVGVQPEEVLTLYRLDNDYFDSL